MQSSTQIKILLLAGVLSSGLASASAFSAEASATIASQYLLRGFDLSQDDPVLQGDYIVSHESGFWFGAWGSNYDVGVDDGIEIDFIAGYDVSVSDDISVGFGVTQYTYSGDVDSSTEFYISATFSLFSVAYYDDIDLETGYFSLDAEFDLAEAVSLALHIGNYNYDGADSNSDYSISLSYSVTDAIGLFATYSSNDIDMPGAEDYFVAGISIAF